MQSAATVTPTLQNHIKLLRLIRPRRLIVIHTIKGAAAH